jgi:uncharacterized protein
MIEWLAPIVGASLLGSAHCAGMCGGIVTFAVGSESGGSRAATHFAYQASRGAAYTSLGFGAGALGASFNSLGTLFGFEHSIAFATGALMVLWAVATLWPTFGLSQKATRWFGPGPSRLARWFRPIAELPPKGRAATLGALTALLPCGWLYAFVLAAAGTGSALRGAAVMAAFWLGSVPVLVGLGTVGRSLSRLLGARTPLLSAGVVLALGFLNLWSHYNVPAHALSNLASPAALDSPVAAEPPCH